VSAEIPLFRFGTFATLGLLSAETVFSCAQFARIQGFPIPLIFQLLTQSSIWAFRCI